MSPNGTRREGGITGTKNRKSNGGTGQRNRREKSKGNPMRGAKQIHWEPQERRMTEGTKKGIKTRFRNNTGILLDDSELVVVPFWFRLDSLGIHLAPCWTRLALDCSSYFPTSETSKDLQITADNPRRRMLSSA